MASSRDAGVLCAGTIWAGLPREARVFAVTGPSAARVVPERSRFQSFLPSRVAAFVAVDELVKTNRSTDWPVMD